jgi:RNA polymerase sigma-70 factor (ECF subfamily)
MRILKGLRGNRGLEKKLAHSRERLYRMALVWSRDPDLAADLTQETLSRALKKQDQLRSDATLDAWLYRILNNAWLDHVRRRRETLDIDDLELADEETPDRLCQQQELVNTVRCAVARLPQGQRQVLTLVDLEDFSYKEVAEILDIPIGTVMSRLCRARGALKNELLKQQVNTGKTAYLRRVK